ncbi:HAMP domain-containing protein [Bradyrhizobium japonicum]|uniref:HAMP domain-containing protein n=1 Tax=Bradyrhizobium japonicum TaxID=375 RepID=UPI0006512679|nr:methyl-accepting chemotaxis protein [Bradyrhizobium japonicum]KMJ96235.1 chemotaxis protein [Bradyrhizobium japonicum]
MSGRIASPSKRTIFPTLRFRAKIILGFAAVLVISAGSMAFSYFGFERVSSGVGSYRSSVTEADLARNIDRELLAYRSAVKYFVVTGKEDDAKAALDAETGLKNAIDQAVKSAQKPARQEGLNKLAKEFSNFSATFAKVLQAKRDSALLVQNQLTRQANLLKYKLDDIGNNASDSEAQSIEFGTKQVNAQFQTASAAATNFVLTSDQAIATSALARLKFVENSLGAVYSMDDKIVAGLKDAKTILVAYREALEKLIANAKMVDELVTEMSGSAGAILQGATAMKADLVAEQQRLDSESEATIGRTEQLVLMLAVGGTLLGAILAFLLGTGISRPMIAMCKAMRELASGNFDVVLPGLGRKDEIGEMAGAVEEFKVQAVAKAERDAAASEAQNKELATARRSELIRFADDFESAVGAIVSNVSASAVQLESAASTLTRTAETTQSLSSQVAGVSEQASSNMQSVATATEELSASVEEIGRQVQTVAQGTQTAATDIGQVNRGAAETGSASEEVLNSAKTLSSESTRLRAELDRFMGNIRAA